ncbi:MAG TPA: pyridoxal-phosphate dependent enzyme [Cyclobacteriaceae bacterium]|nr:pyridoxal-phosphate dependent enzyme [Cyclobacteriaceae bacterium]
MLKYFDTPVLEIKGETVEKCGIRLFVKREDLNHPFVSGNKWWKLKYNLEEAKKLGNETILTFGGAFSNHIYATAAAAKELGFKSAGVIRGERILPLNQTLSFAEETGMKLHFVSRTDYRTKSEEFFIEKLRASIGDFYLIPEGGSNSLAVKGCAEFARKKLSPIEFDYLCLPVGTGGTMAGIIAGLEGKKNIVGFSVLKNGDFLKDEVRRLLLEFSPREYSNWHIQADYHFGGYAKQTPDLMQLALEMKQLNNLPLDPIYTAKTTAGIFDLIEKKYFNRGSTVLMLHTGGLRPASPEY